MQSPDVLYTPMLLADPNAPTGNDTKQDRKKRRVKKKVPADSNVESNGDNNIDAEPPASNLQRTKRRVRVKKASNNGITNVAASGTEVAKPMPASTVTRGPAESVEFEKVTQNAKASNNIRVRLKQADVDENTNTGVMTPGSKNGVIKGGLGLANGRPAFNASFNKLIINKEPGDRPDDYPAVIPINIGVTSGNMKPKTSDGLYTKSLAIKPQQGNDNNINVNPSQMQLQQLRNQVANQIMNGAPVRPYNPKGANERGSVMSFQSIELNRERLAQMTIKILPKDLNKMSDEEKIQIDREVLQEMKTGDLDKVFKGARRFQERKEGESAEEVYFSEEREIELYAYYKQATKGNFKKRYKLAKSVLDLPKHNRDELWRSIQGMPRREAKIDYIETIQQIYFARTNARNQELLRPNALSTTSERIMRLFSMKITDSVGVVSDAGTSNDLGNREQAFDSMDFASFTSNGASNMNVEKYRKTISQGEFRRYTEIKKAKMNEENKRITAKLKSVELDLGDLSASELADMDAGTSKNKFTERQAASIRLVKEEFFANRKISVDEDDDDSIFGLSDEEEQDENDNTVVKPKPPKDAPLKERRFYDHSQYNKGGDHRPIPRSMAFRNSREPYNLVRDVIDNLVKEISSKMITRLSANDKFSGTEKPTIRLDDYLFRLARYMDSWFYEAPSPRSVGCRSLIMSMIYLYRVRKDNPKDFFVTEFNVHRLFAVCVLLAAKFSEDYIVANSYWAEVSGIPAEELNTLEEMFCQFMQFNFFVSESELNRFCSKREII